MGLVVSFEGYTPPPRFDGHPWAEARIEEAATSEGTWALIDTVTFGTVDVDPTAPAVRSFTTDQGTVANQWYRVIFADAGGNTALPTTPVQNFDQDSAYVDETELRSMLTLQGTSFVDSDIQRAIRVVNPAINSLCNREFDKQTPVGDTEVRYYRPQSASVCHINDAISISELLTDQNGDMDFEHVWNLDRDVALWPLNATADGRPFTRIDLNPWAAIQGFPYWHPKSVKITGRFGWAAVPDDVIGASYLLAARLIKRWRQAPLAVVTVGTDVGSAIRVGRDDPDVTALLKDWTREEIV